MTENPLDIVRKIALLGAIGKEVSKEDKAAREAAKGILRPGNRLSAVIGETEVGRVRVDAGSRTAQVVDEKAFMAWVKKTHPSEIETITKVRTAYTSMVLSTAKDNGVPVDPASGEVIPGVEFRQGEPKVVLETQTDDQRKTVISAYWAGELREITR